MRFLSFRAESPADALALEEAIHLGLEDGSSPPTWRVWEAAQPAIILGTGQEHQLEVHLDAARAAGLPVLRRHSGGGAVLIGPGVLNFSGFYLLNDLPGSETITGAMVAALRPVLDALGALRDAQRAPLELRFELAGLSDITASAPNGALKKIAGNAQARKRHSVLVHGSLLADPNWELIECVLKFPSRPPDYRAGRSHREFLTSLKELGLPHTLEAFGDALKTTVNSTLATEALPTELARMRELADKKYSRDEWNLRR